MISSSDMRRALRRLSATFFWSVGALLVLCSVGSTAELSRHVTEPYDPPELFLSAGADKMFSKEWMWQMLASGEEGDCSHPVRKPYTWRNVGWGSNMNQILLRWMDSTLRGTYNIALDVWVPHLQQLNCSSVAGEAGKSVRGWECLFRPMNRLCALNSREEKKMLVKEDANEITPLAADFDKVEAYAALLQVMYSNIQPWFANGIETILTKSGQIAAVRSGAYVAIHVRRGDKQVKGEGRKVEVQVYLQVAASYIEQSSAHSLGVDTIAGIWVSSDDAGVVAETYDLYVGLNAELRMLSEADVFVGTFSSNVARLVFLMRETNGLLRKSTISVDHPEWFEG